MCIFKYMQGLKFFAPIPCIQETNIKKAHYHYIGPQCSLSLSMDTYWIVYSLSGNNKENYPL